MSDHRQNMKAFRGALGQFVNLAPRQMDSDVNMSATIDKAISSLEAIRPKAAALEPEETPDEAEKTEDDSPELDLETSKRKAKKGKDRMHTGGENREG